MRRLPPNKPLSIDYHSEGFPTGVLNGKGSLQVSWDDILWAAVTIGRPSVHHVFQHRTASVYEAIFRWSMIRMALEQSGALARKFRRTDAFKTLDPTEKGAVNYFLGMVVCKLFASAKLDTPWLLHLDVFRPLLNPRLLRGYSRPDLVGEHRISGEWHAFESKGRASPPGSKEKRKAKDQALRLVTVMGKKCSLHIGAIAYFKGDTLHFYWRDPPPQERGKVDLPEARGVWRDYYLPVVELARDISDDGSGEVEQLDLRVAIHPELKPLLFEGDWHGARQAARELGGRFQAEGYRPDGLLIRSGPSWAKQQAEA